MPYRQSRRTAIIDLGSNTTRLIVMKGIGGYIYQLSDEVREVVRLRKGMTSEGLSPEAIERALLTLRLFKRFCEATRVDTVIATATSAVRDAPNGPAFIDQVYQEIGLGLRILDGEQEAYYEMIGALNEVPLQDGYIMGIGGGSMQISQVQSRRMKACTSLPIGTIALTERFVQGDPIKKRELRDLQNGIDQQLDQISWLKPNGPGVLVGTGGTIRNLAKIAIAQLDYPLNTLHGYDLSRASIAHSIELFKSLPLEKRKAIRGLNRDRADIILPGAMVVHSVMERLDMSAIRISVNGLREGLFFEQFWRDLPSPVIDDVRGFGVLNMARTYHYEKAHADHVRYLSSRMFDDLQALHGYGPDERELLEAAAILHDVGVLVNFSDHHKHSESLIINSGIPGFSARETAIVALLTRYHRKGTPDTSSYHAVLRPEDDRLVWQLAALLRLAEKLERGRSQAVRGVEMRYDDDSLEIVVDADEYPGVEIWEAERSAAELVEAAFGRRVTLKATLAPPYRIALS
ncbi:MAG: Ppx/GppA family phosphatase [Chloroflexi bacterium]|nr:Ppx/GppA family phosphatase [Chloroflexota bacterium]